LFVVESLIATYIIYAVDLYCAGKPIVEFGSARAIETGLTESPRVPDLFAQILIRGVRRLQRRELDRGYKEVDAVLETMRGRIDLNETVRRNLLVKRQIGCRFDELAPDVLHNQIIKTSIGGLARSADLNGALAEELRAIDRSLGHISKIKLTSQCFRGVQVSRNRGQYRLLLNVCELLHHLQLPTELLSLLDCDATVSSSHPELAI
jgi:5-methylcytosine-specific restriction enzyme subunit McrC